jgi:hypothetical protein
VTARRRLGLALCVLIGLLAPPAVAAQQQATASPHGALQEACGDCHAASGWKPAHVTAAFDHGSNGFALAGAHARTTCRACHASLDFRGASRDCVGCHSDVHRGELGSDCARCHTPRSFLDRAAMVRGHQTSRFALTGAHVTADCESCHLPSAQGQLTFVNRASDCVQCHADAYRSAKQPDHIGGGFPQDCNLCHATSAWPRARFNHATTQFPLTGAHRAVSCQQCHGDGVYRGKDANCVSCHQSAYDGTTNPGHRDALFPTTCAVCHSTTAWQPASFDHSITAFPLTGAHRVVSCLSCHADGVYTGKTTACAGCHQSEYDGTTDPPHQAAQLPTTCESCHTTTTWTGAQFDHDAPYFPIYSGAHNGTWASCATCHTDAGSYQAFTCLTCHEHSKSSMDSKHSGRSDYLYDSQACYSCHPRGRT